MNDSPLNENLRQNMDGDSDQPISDETDSAASADRDTTVIRDTSATATDDSHTQLTTPEHDRVAPRFPVRYLLMAMTGLALLMVVGRSATFSAPWAMGIVAMLLFVIAFFFFSFVVFLISWCFSAGFDVLMDRPLVFDATGSESPPELLDDKGKAMQRNSVSQEQQEMQTEGQ
ncbi:MAG: hypothetical protein AAFP69_05490 [Planctomycetota bacterium]